MLESKINTEKISTSNTTDTINQEQMRFLSFSVQAFDLRKILCWTGFQKKRVQKNFESVYYLRCENSL